MARRSLPLLPASTRSTPTEKTPTERDGLTPVADRPVPALHVRRQLDRTIPLDPTVPPLTPDELAERPRTRGDCADGPRPCPWYSCKQHLGLDVDSRTGSVQLHIDPDHLDAAPETCALDLADRGGVTLEEVGEALGVTRERARQLEEKALAKLGRRVDPAKLDL